MWTPARYSLLAKRPTVQNPGPGDVVSGALGWWGLRAYSSAVRGTNSCRIIRVSDNAEQDFTTNATTGALDRASIVTFLASTTGRFVTFYDQSGSGRNLTQATAANQADVNLSGLGSQVTADFNNGAQMFYLSTSTVTQGQPLTYSVAAKSITYSSQQSLLIDSANGVQMGYRRAADNTAFIYAGTHVPATATDSSFHSLQGVYDGASSFLDVDGSSTSGNPGAQTISAANIRLGNLSGGQLFHGSWLELGLWAGAFSGAQCTSMDTNQSAFWGY